MITGPPDPSSSKPSTTEDQCPHDALAKFSLCDQQCAKPIWRYHQSIDRGLRRCINEGRPAGQLRQLAQERPDDVRNNNRTSAGQSMSGNVYFAGENDCQTLADFAGLSQNFSRLV